MSAYLRYCEADGLRVFPERGVAWYPVHEVGQKQRYFQEYKDLENSPISDELLDFREGLVRKHCGRPQHLPSVLDVGIGSGAFIARFAGAHGYDVDPESIVWMHENDCVYLDPTIPGALDDLGAVTFWDSLEHIRYPEKILGNISDQVVFVSIPLFTDFRTQLRRSKHYKPNEHYWYFSLAGITEFFEFFGFEQLECSRKETELGREDIWTLVYRRPQSAPQAPTGLAPLPSSGKVEASTRGDSTPPTGKNDADNTDGPEPTP